MPPCGRRPSRVHVADPSHPRGRPPARAAVRAAGARLARRARRRMVRAACAPTRGSRRRGARPTLPAELARALIGWSVDQDGLLDALVWCRRHPGALRPTFRSTDAWSRFVAALHGSRRAPCRRRPPAGARRGRRGRSLPAALLGGAHGRGDDAGGDVLMRPPPVGRRSRRSCTGDSTARRCCSPSTASTCARRTSRPLAAPPAGQRFLASRLARGLSLATYASADVIAPVTEANERWELGSASTRAHPRDPQRHHPPPPARRRAAEDRLDRPDRPAEGRADDAARRRRGETAHPAGALRVLGAPTEGQEPYARACEELRRLSLGDGFRFMGTTRRRAGRARRRRRPHDEHLRGPADGDPRGDGGGPRGRRHRRRRRPGRAARMRDRRPLGRRRGARDRGHDAAAQPGVRDAARAPRVRARARALHAAPCLDATARCSPS